MGAQRPVAEHERGDESDFALAETSRLRIIRRLGAGGMGVVYEALDRERNVRVALKTLRETNAQTLYRFKHEFRALAQIVHPRLVPLFELFAEGEGERWFFTMELVEDGVSLMSWVRGPQGRRDSGMLARTQRLDRATPCDAETVPARYLGDLGSSRAQEDVRAGASAPPDYDVLRAAFAQLAEGVQVLHAAERLHRDLKPENVFVRGGTGDVVLLDFGLVAALDSQRASGTWLSTPPEPPSLAVRPLPSSDSQSQNANLGTQEGSIAGTIAYMAPEQALGQPLSTASDWYAVGVMLYEALTGRLPVEGGDVEIILGKQGKALVPPSARVPETPPDLDALCMELLRTNPSERPQGHEVVLRLGGALDPSVDDGSPPAGLFVGRAQQLLALRRAFDLSLDNTVIARVYGRSGAGKSSLLASFLAQLDARPDTIVLTGRCYEQEFIPFKAVDSLMDALTHYLVQCSDETVAALLPADAPLLARLFPVLGRVIRKPDASDEPADLRAVRRRAFIAMRELMARIAHRVRLVLFIDDLQWGDLDSMALLAELTRSPGAPPMLVVFAHRSEHSDKNACLVAMNELAASACPVERRIELDVGALGEADARELAGTLLGTRNSAPGLDWVVRQASGSAFLIHELSRHVHKGGVLTAAEGLALDDILWQRVLALPQSSRALLTVVAVAGRPVALPVAQRAAELEALDPRLIAALRAERLLRTDGAAGRAQIETFHDRVRESILARIPANDFARYSSALAHVLETTGDADPETLAVLFEQAGELGRASASYAAAVPKAVAALAFERAELLAHKAIELAQTEAELAAAHEAAIHFYTDMERFTEAYAMTQKGAAALGIELPAKFAPPAFIASFLATQARLLGRTPASLLDLPTMPQGRLRLAVRLANAGAKAAYQIRPELCVALCTKIVALCLEHGNSPDCAIGYMVFGAIFQGGILGRYTVGYELGQLALAILDKYENDRQRSEVCFVVGYFGMSWLRPVVEAEALWRTAFEAGRTSGDLFHMGCAAAGRMMSLHMRGAPLDVIEREADELSEVLARSGLRESLAVVSAVRQAGRALRGVTRSLHSWQDERYDEADAARAWQAFGIRHFAHYCHLARAQSLYLAGRLDDAALALSAAKQLAPESKGTLHSAEQVLVEALVGAARFGRLSALERVAMRVQLTRCAAKLQGWAKRCPQNFGAKAELARAELDRIAGRNAEALEGYARAARSAKDSSYVHVAALAHLLAARLSTEPNARGRSLELARVYLRAWGASALAERPDLLELDTCAS